MFNKLFSPRKSCRLCDNVEKYGITRQATDDNMIRHMPFTGRLIKATDTHSEYVILIGFPRQQCLANAPHFYVHKSTDIFGSVIILVHAVNFACTSSPT